MSGNEGRLSMTDQPTRTINYACPGGCSRRCTVTITDNHPSNDYAALIECQDCHDRRFAPRPTFWQRIKKVVGL